MEIWQRSIPIFADTKGWKIDITIEWNVSFEIIWSIRFILVSSTLYTFCSFCLPFSLPFVIGFCAALYTLVKYLRTFSVQAGPNFHWWCVKNVTTYMGWSSPSQNIGVKKNRIEWQNINIWSLHGVCVMWNAVRFLGAMPNVAFLLAGYLFAFVCTLTFLRWISTYALAAHRGHFPPAKSPPERS